MLSNRQLFLACLAQTSPDPIMLEINSAEGIYVYSPSGEKYIDIIAGVSVSSLGHSHPEVIENIKAQLDKHMHLMVYGELIQSPQVRYAQNLCNALGPGFDNVYFVNSGSEAIEGSLKLARKCTGRSEIVSFMNAYHGSTLGAMSIMGNNDFKKGFYPLLPDTRKLNFNCPEELDNITIKTACVVIEPIQAEAGVILPSDNYLQLVRKRCDETGSLLIFDEIQTGFGRTGEIFAFQKLNVIPDIIVLAKSLGGGLPLGAFICSKELMKSLNSNPALAHITTFGGHPLSCAAGMTTLQIIQRESLHKSVLQKENRFRQKLIHPVIKEIRGTGLLLAIEFNSPELMRKIVKLALKNGVITDWFLFCDTALRISPPLTISEKEIDEACSIIIASIDEAVAKKGK